MENRKETTNYMEVWKLGTTTCLLLGRMEKMEQEAGL